MADSFRRATMIELFGECSDTECNSENEAQNDFSEQEPEDSHELQEQIQDSLCGSLQQNEEDSLEVLQQNEEEQMDEGLHEIDMQAINDMLENGPQSGMKFQSRECLFAAYQEYAKEKGFSVSTRNKKGDKYLMITCGRGRKPSATKCTKRMNCPARINAIKQDDDQWKVSKVCNTHNHDLEPHLSVMMPAHRHLSNNMKRQLEARDMAGIRVCKNIRLLQFLAGGPSNLGATVKDCRNFIDKRRRLRLGEGDAAAIQKIFKRLQQQDRNFFHLMDLDDDGRLRNVMWIHPRSRAAYEEFHDVVSFDTTYLVNQYNMPFGTVVGINHHNQSILLGCALFTSEHAESFKWFFTNWLDAMGGVQPTSILTDQCESIRIALREVMPDSIHRFCLWHIVSKTAKKFKGVADTTKASSDFNSMIYHSLSVEEFERRWGEFLAEHGLHNNRWLRDLYDERQSWVPVYSNHIFWAGMVSTQRSESMHAFFDGYITSRSTLKTFVEQYEICINDKIRNELKEEHTSKCRNLQCFSEFGWEEQFSMVYTNNIMLLFQKQVKRVWNCNVNSMEAVDSSRERYEISERGNLSGWSHKEFNFIVEYRPIGQYISCNCRKFECKGILCCHILKVLSYKNIQKVNERYILRRWRKDVYRPYFSIFFAGGYPHMTREYKRHQELEKESQHCCDLAIDSDEKFQFAKMKFKEIQEELMNWSSVSAARIQENASEIGDQLILDPLVTRPRGRPRANRMKNPAEASRSRSRGRGRGNSLP